MDEDSIFFLIKKKLKRNLKKINKYSINLVSEAYYYSGNKIANGTGIKIMNTNSI